MTDSQKLAELIFGDITKTPEDYENLYPPRQLKEGAAVTRLAPSPTGYLHLGVLFAALVNRRVADASDGIFYLRIEDTDRKREVVGGMEDIISGLLRFDINIDEGFTSPDKVEGVYAPYKQSDRREIYRCYAKKLMADGLAYPCFCTENELSAVRENQEHNKERTGYYGKYAKCADLSFEEISKKLESGIPFVVRLRSSGDESRRISFNDGIKGKIEMPENDEHFVLLKSDGIPTYHFAHAVDDHLMHTTTVIRGDEWISSVPKHLQLFRLLGFKAPKYAHISPIMKEENGGKRKLSKRKDPEAAVHFYAEQGYPAESVTEYMLTIANSDYEDWRRANKDADNKSFKLNLKKMSVSGALFDIAKLNDVSKNVISTMDANTVTERVISWAKEYDIEFYSLLNADKNYAVKIFSIDRGNKKPRKDIAKWSDAKEYTAYFFDKLFENYYPLPENISAADAASVLKAYRNIWNIADQKDEWFAKIKSICPDIGFASEVKEYKASPDSFKGHVGDASSVIRSAVTGRLNTPDLCSIMQTLGEEKVLSRIDNAIKHFEKEC